MKVNDIRSFFSKPGTSRGGSAVPEEQVVDVPSRLKKGSSKKPKKDDDRLRVSIERSDDDSDKEEPLPRKHRKQEDKSGKGSKSKKKAVIDDDDDSDREDPLPRSARKKNDKDKGSSQDKKRKARVLSDSDDDDFKPTQQSQRQKKGSSEKPAAKQVKVDKSAESKQKDLKPVNPADFFSKAPVRREAKKEPKEKEKTPATSDVNTSPEKKKGKQSPVKIEEPSSSKTPPKSKPQNGNGNHHEDSPQKPRTSLIEPKKLKMETPSPERRRSGRLESSPEKKVEEKSKKPEKKAEEKSSKSPEKKDTVFKVPTPVTSEKSRSRTTGAKRSVTTDEDDEEEDFNPKQKAATSKNSKSKSTKSGATAAKSSVTTDEDDEEEDFNPKQKATPSKNSKSKSTASRDKKTPTPSKTKGADEDDAAKEASKQNYMKYLAKMSMKPKNLGSKEIPVGKPDCLQGLTFVISGVLDSLEREDCKALIEKYGGRVTGSVSGKTSYLVVGDDPGESKVKKAVQLKVPQISEDDVLEMLRKSNPSANSQDSGMANSEDMSVVDSERFKTEDDEDYDADKSLFSSPAPTSSKSGRSSSRTSSPQKLGKNPSKLAKEESPSKKLKTEKDDKKESGMRGIEKKVENPKSSKPTATTTAPPPAQSTAHPDAGLMWVDKYKPKTLKNVVGQVSEASNARKLVRWLQNWFNYHGTSQDKPKASWPGLKDPEGKTFKAALLSGPPGIGKTTSAHLAVKEVGYDYFELNASDTRNKRGLHENVADALSSKSLVFNRGNEELARKHVLIMDEVDGMSGNEDRGGVQELIALIKSSRVPVICICNDRNHQKIRSLANYCFDLRFNKPTFEQLKAFIMSICFKEKIKIPQEKVTQLIISTDNDVRQILHQLELFKEGKSDQAYNPKKDLKFGPWDVIRKVFLKSEHDKMSIHDKNGLFFQDYSLGPLFVQENYLKWAPAKAGGNRQKTMDLVSKTAGSLADGDMVDSVIRRNQNWSLLPVQAVFSSFLPGEYMESNQVGNVEFPQWLGKNSNKNKRHRLLQGLHTHLHLQVSGSLEALNMDYLPYLRRSITKPLVAGDHLEAAKIMEDYTLLRDDVESINDLSLWPGTKDPMERVETKVKAAFTRQVNKEILPYSNAKPVKGKGRGGGGAQEDDLEGLLEEGEGEAVEEEEDESVEKDAMVKIKTRKAGSSKAAATSAKGKGKKVKDDDEEDYAKSSKGSKSKAPSKSRKGK